MRVFRLSRRKYAQNLDRKGAAKSNNRWNSKGTEMVYTAASRALAMAEVSVHLSLNILPTDFMMLEIDIPDTVAIGVLKIPEFVKDWNGFPYSKWTQARGDEFIASQTECILQVPSAVVPGDFNYLLNPLHPEMKSIHIVSRQDFAFDRRIFEKS